MQSPSPGAAVDADAAFDALDQAIAQSRRWRRPITVLLVEIAGSEAPDLAGLSRFLSGTLRDTDAVWPIRHDRLLVLLADADAAGSAPPIGRIRTGLGPDVAGALTLGQVTPAPGIGAEDVLSLAESSQAPLGAA